MDDKDRALSGNHKLNIQGRKQSQFTGIKEVVSFDAKEVVLDTVMGTLIVRGEDLFFKKLTVEAGEVELDGQIDSLIYTNKSASRKGQDSLLKRMFR